MSRNVDYGTRPWLSNVKASTCTVVGAVGCYNQMSIRINITHAGGFPRPVVRIVLTDAKTIYPQVSDSQVAGHDDRIHEGLWHLG